jgi:hypothetical protein
MKKCCKSFAAIGLGIPARAGVAARKSAARGKYFRLLFYANGSSVERNSFRLREKH